MNELMKLFFDLDMPDEGGSEERSELTHLSLPPSTSLSEVKTAVDLASEKGVFCPCCGQFVKLYKRKLNANMAEFLCSLVVRYRETQDWVSFKECRFNGRDYSYVSHWELAETRLNTDSKKKHSGFWRPTPKGIEFAQGKISVPSHVFVYDNEVRRWSETHVSISQVFDRYFDYTELMNR